MQSQHPPADDDVLAHHSNDVDDMDDEVEDDNDNDNDNDDDGDDTQAALQAMMGFGKFGSVKKPKSSYQKSFAKKNGGPAAGTGANSQPVLLKRDRSGPSLPPAPPPPPSAAAATTTTTTTTRKDATSTPHTFSPPQYLPGSTSHHTNYSQTPSSRHPLPQRPPPSSSSPVSDQTAQTPLQLRGNGTPPQPRPTPAQLESETRTGGGYKHPKSGISLTRLELDQYSRGRVVEMPDGSRATAYFKPSFIEDEKLWAKWENRS